MKEGEVGINTTRQRRLIPLVSI